MQTYPLLVTTDFQEGLAGIEVHRILVRQAEKLYDDQFTALGKVATRSNAIGWVAPQKPILQRISGTARSASKTALWVESGRKSKVSADQRWHWSLSPQGAWPAPYQLVELDKQSGQQRVVWEDPSCEIVDLQVDPSGCGVYFVVDCTLGLPRLMFWDSHQQKSFCRYRKSDFQPGEFAVHPDGKTLAYVHQEDDQIYRVDLPTRRQRRVSEPELELEYHCGYRAYRTSPTFSPDGSRLFYCTAYLELSGMELINWGHLYILSEEQGQLRRLELNGCPLNVVAPNAGAMQQAVLAA